MQLFDFYQRGTVVKYTAVNGTENATIVPVPFETYEEPPSVSTTPLRYIVFPREKVSPTTSKDIEDIVECTTYFENCPSSFVLVEWTIGNVKNLAQYSSGAAFKGLTNEAYNKASQALLESYNIVEHDVKELNKIKALQTDVSILGNMNYYRMIIYAVVLFFLLVSVYYIYASG